MNSVIWGLYDRVFVPVMLAVLRLLSLVNPKIRQGLAGRADLIEQVRKHYSTVKAGKRVLIHVASFGELEQAKPVVEALKQRLPDLDIHLTFFSPSGYLNAKDRYTLPDLITYLPVDSKRSVDAFLSLAKPDLVLFTRYDVWPNVARALHQRGIPTILFSATYNEASRRKLPLVERLNRQVYSSLSSILTNSSEDLIAFEELGVQRTKLSVVGDTRFDQVFSRFEQSHELQVLPDDLSLKLRENSSFVFVAGSIWQSDEKVILPFLKKSIARKDNVLVILVPHEPTDGHVARLLKEFDGQAIRLSKIEHRKAEKVIVVDSIGKLFALYRYADLAYVGGGFGTSVHNVLEPAVWGAPVVVGPNHARSTEVQKLIDAGAGYEIKSDGEFEFVAWRMMKDDAIRDSAANTARDFVKAGRGATSLVVTQAIDLLHNTG